MGIPSSCLAPLTLVIASVRAAPIASTASPSSSAASPSPTCIARASISFISSITSLASSLTISNVLSSSCSSVLLAGCLFNKPSNLCVMLAAFSNRAGFLELILLVTTSSVLDDTPDMADWERGIGVGNCLNDCAGGRVSLGGCVRAAVLPAAASAVSTSAPVAGGSTAAGLVLTLLLSAPG